MGMLPRIPKKMCNQSIKIEVANGKEDGYGHVQTEDVALDHVLVQPQTIYSGTSNNRTITANAVVFLFAGVTTPMPKIDKNWVGYHLTFEGNDYTITNIVDNREPYSNDVYSYELEVL